MSQPYDHIKQAGGLGKAVSKIFKPRSIPVRSHIPAVKAVESAAPTITPIDRQILSSPAPNLDTLTKDELYPFSNLYPSSFREDYETDKIPKLLTRENVAEELLTPSVHPDVQFGSQFERTSRQRLLDPFKMPDGVPLKHRSAHPHESLVGVTSPAEQFIRIYGHDTADMLRSQAVRHQHSYPELQGSFTPIYTDEKYFRDLPVYYSPDYGAAYVTGGGRPNRFEEGPGDFNTYGLNDKALSDIWKTPALDMWRLRKDFLPMHETTGVHEATHALEARPPISMLYRGAVPSRLDDVLKPYEGSTYGLRFSEIYPHISEMRAAKFLMDRANPSTQTNTQIDDFISFWDDQLARAAKNKYDFNLPGYDSKLRKTDPRAVLKRYSDIIRFLKHPSFRQAGENILRGSAQANPTPAGSLEAPTKLASAKPYDHIKQAGGRLPRIFSPGIFFKPKSKITTATPRGIAIPGHPYSINDPNWAKETYGPSFSIDKNITAGIPQDHRADLDTLGKTFQSSPMIVPADNITGFYSLPFLGITSPAIEHAKIYGEEGAHLLRTQAIGHQLAHPELQGTWTPGYGDSRYFKPLPIFGEQENAYRTLQDLKQSNRTTPAMLLQPYGAGDVYGVYDTASDFGKRWMGGGPVLTSPIHAAYSRITPIHEALGHGAQYDDINKALQDKQLRYWDAQIDSGRYQHPRLQPREVVDAGLSDPHTGRGESHTDYSFRPVEIYPHISEMRALRYLMDRANPSTQTNAQIDDFISFWDGTLEGIRKNTPPRAIEDVPPVLLQNHAIDSVHQLPPPSNPEFYLQRYGGLLDFLKHPKFREAGENILRGSATNTTPAKSLEAPAKLASAKPYDHVKQATTPSSYHEYLAKGVYDLPPGQIPNEALLARNEYKLQQQVAQNKDLPVATRANIAQGGFRYTDNRGIANIISSNLSDYWDRYTNNWNTAFGGNDSYAHEGDHWTRTAGKWTNRVGAGALAAAGAIAGAPYALAAVPKILGAGATAGRTIAQIAPRVIQPALNTYRVGAASPRALMRMPGVMNNPLGRVLYAYRTTNTIPDSLGYLALLNTGLWGGDAAMRAYENKKNTEEKLISAGADPETASRLAYNAHIGGHVSLAGHYLSNLDKYVLDGGGANKFDQAFAQSSGSPLPGSIPTGIRQGWNLTSTSNPLWAATLSVGYPFINKLTSISDTAAQTAEELQQIDPKILENPSQYLNSDVIRHLYRYYKDDFKYLKDNLEVAKAYAASIGNSPNTITFTPGADPKIQFNDGILKIIEQYEQMKQRGVKDSKALKEILKAQIEAFKKYRAAQPKN